MSFRGNSRGRGGGGFSAGRGGGTFGGGGFGGRGGATFMLFALKQSQ